MSDVMFTSKTQPRFRLVRLNFLMPSLMFAVYDTPTLRFLKASGKAVKALTVQTK